jgi:hypothetical protein
METLEIETPIYEDTTVPIHPDMSSGSPCIIANPITYEDKSSPVIPRTPTLLRRSEVLAITYEDTPETHETPLQPERKTIVGVVAKRRPDTPATRSSPRTHSIRSNDVLAEYARVVCDIRNMRTLRTSHRIAIQQFSRAQLLEIIDIYDLIIQNVDYMFS